MMNLATILFGVSLLAAVACGAWSFARGGGRGFSERLLAAVLPAGFLVSLFEFLRRNAGLPGDHWSSFRYSTSVALSKGIWPYNGPTQGAVSGWIYPPFGLVAYLPAALLPDPTLSHRVAGALSGLYYFLPAYLLLRASFAGARPWTARAGLYLNAAFLLFCLFSLTEGYLFHSFVLTYVNIKVGVDAPALGCAAMACAFLLRYQDGRGRGALLASAVFASLALWTKQVCFPLFVVLPAWILATEGLRAAFAYALVLLCALLASSALFFSAFGTQDMIFNIARIPTSHPWIGQFPRAVAGVGLEFEKLLFALLVVPGAALLHEITEGRRGLSWSAWLRENRWLLPLATGLLLIPTSLLGRLKLGGDLNSFAYSGYFLLVASCALVAKLSGRRDDEAGSPFVCLVAALLVGATLIGAQDLASRLKRPAPLVNDTITAYNYLKDHPGGTYFPSNPLAHLAAEGKQYHFEYGIFDREIARVPMSRSHFESAIPANTELICFPPDMSPSQWDSVKLVVERYMTDFRPVEAVPELPGWHCYRRQPAAR